MGKGWLVFLAAAGMAGCYVDFGDEGGSWDADGRLDPVPAEYVRVTRGELRGQVSDVTVEETTSVSAYGDPGYLHVTLDGRGPGGWAMVMVDLVPSDGRLDPGDRISLSAIAVEGFDEPPPGSGIACAGPEAGDWHYDAPLAGGEVIVEAGAAPGELNVTCNAVLDTGQHVTATFAL